MNLPLPDGFFVLLGKPGLPAGGVTPVITFLGFEPEGLSGSFAVPLTFLELFFDTFFSNIVILSIKNSS